MRPQRTRNGFEIQTTKIKGVWHAEVNPSEHTIGKTKKEAVEKLKHKWNVAAGRETLVLKQIERKLKKSRENKSFIELCNFFMTGFKKRG